MLEKINEVITNEVNPVLGLHNGSCEAVDFENGVVSLKMLGGCTGCPSAKLTLLNGVQPILQKAFPEVKDIILV